MTIWFVSRHPGARQWAEEEGITVDRVVTHLDLRQIARGDTVIGTLPVHLAAEVCARGARYRHLSLELPSGQRGRDLSAVEMRACRARIETYMVRRMED